jgi:hypothetical protein
VQQKKPLFLLEIVIAIFLVGLFSAYFLRSSISTLYQERKALLDLEFERLYDLHRMTLISNNWQKVDQLPKLEGDAKKESCQFEVKIAGKPYFRTKTFTVFCPKRHDKAYDLCIKEEKKKYHFLVKKAEAFSKCSGMSIPNPS